MANNDGTRAALNVVKVFMSIFLSIIFYMLVVIAIMKAGKFSYDFMYQIFGDVSVQEAPGTDLEFEVNDENESLMSVASRLEYSKLIVNKYSFFIRAKLDSSGISGPYIKTGTFELNTSMNYADILSVITDKSTEGDEVK